MHSSHDIILQAAIFNHSFESPLNVILNGHTVGGLTVYIFAFTYRYMYSVIILKAGIVYLSFETSVDVNCY